MKRKMFALITGTVLSVCPLVGCGASDDGLFSNVSELIDEMSPNDEGESAPGVLHLHDENNECYCIDIPSDWGILEQKEKDGKTITKLTPNSDQSGNSGVIAVSFGRSTNPDLDIEEYIEKLKADSEDKHSDCTFTEGTTEVNGYSYVAISYTKDDGDSVIDYHIFDLDAELRIMQLTTDDEEVTTGVTDVAMVMVNSAVLYHPEKEETDEAETDTDDAEDASEEQDSDVVHVSDPDNEEYSADFSLPSDWGVVENEATDSVETEGLTFIFPNSDQSGDSGLIIVGVGHTESDITKSDIDALMELYANEYPDYVFTDGTTKGNHYYYTLGTFTEDLDRQVSEYEIYDGDAYIIIHVETLKGDDETAATANDVAMMMLNSAVIYHPAEETK